jgi:hypothetical protein
MKRKISENFILVFLITTLSIGGCQFGQWTNPAALTPTSTGSAQVISTPQKTARHPTLNEVLDDESYLEDCKITFPPVYTEQADFFGIYPGITTENELIENLGKSYDKALDPKGYGYGYTELGAFFEIKNKTVDLIYVQPKPQKITHLLKALEKFGCPDVINAQALTDDAFEESVPFNRTVLFYLQAGIYIDLNTYPVRYSQAIDSIIFASPSFLSTIVGFDNLSKPVSFSGAIIEE